MVGHPEDTYGIRYTVNGHGRHHTDWLRDRTTREVVRWASQRDAQRTVDHLTQNLGRHRLYITYWATPIEARQ